MSDQRIDDSLIPPVADQRYVPPPATDYDDRYQDRSGRRAVWTGLLVAAVIIGGGLFYFGHRSEIPSTRVPTTTTTGTAPTSEPRPIPQSPVAPAPPVRAQ